MDVNESLNNELTSYIHSLFINDEYSEWRKGLVAYEPGVWYSLIVKLDRRGAPIEELKRFGENIYSKLVFHIIKAPDYKDSKMFMIQFTIAGGMWHSVVWHRLENS